MHYPQTPEHGSRAGTCQIQSDEDAGIVVLERGEVVEVCVLLVRPFCVRLPEHTPSERVRTPNFSAEAHQSVEVSVIGWANFRRLDDLERHRCWGIGGHFVGFARKMAEGELGVTMARR